MPTVISRLFSVESLIKPDRRLGPLPGTKDAYRELLHIALPSVAEMLMVSLVGSIDTMMVGRLGPEAIAAVGSVSYTHLYQMRGGRDRRGRQRDRAALHV